MVQPAADDGHRRALVVSGREYLLGLKLILDCTS